MSRLRRLERSFPERRGPWRACTPHLGRLEERTLLDGSPLPLSPGTSTDSTMISSGGVYDYRFSSPADGLLTATVASDAPLRLSVGSLAGSQFDPISQTDVAASGTGAGHGTLSIHVAAGDTYLEVRGLGGAGSFTLQADVTASTPPFQAFTPDAAPATPMAVGNLGPGDIADLVLADGVHPGLGDGTFQTTATGPALADPNNNPTVITVANLDGHQDVLVAEAGPDYTESVVRVYLNDGNGNLSLGQTLTVGANPEALLVADLGSGNLDLAVASLATGTVDVFWGDGKGGFNPTPVSFDVGPGPSGLAAGRFDGQHFALVVADQSDPLTGLRIFQYDGNGGFIPTAKLPINLAGTALTAPPAVVVGDFGNGHLDLAVTDSGSNSVSVFLGNGDGTFQAPRPFAVGQSPGAILLGDFNGDGRPDLAVADYASSEVSVLLGNGDGTFQSQLLSGTDTGPQSLAAGHFTRSGRLDLAVGNLLAGDVSVLLGRGDGTFQDQGKNAVGADPIASAVADFNRDGHNDLVTVNQGSNDLSILLGNGDGTFRASKTFPAGIVPNGVAVDDFNKDGRKDIAVTNAGDPITGSGQGVSILMGNGDGTFQAPVLIPAGTNPTALVAGDFGNGQIDLAVADGVSNGGSSAVTVLWGDGHGHFPTSTLVPLGVGVNQPTAIAAGHFTGTGVLDLALANKFSNNVTVLLGDGRGGFQPPFSIPLSEDSSDVPLAIVAGQFDRSGRVGLAVAVNSPNGDYVEILAGDGRGGFTRSSKVPLGGNVLPNALVADYLHGGDALDLVVSEGTGNQVVVLRGAGDGTFVPQTPLATAGFSAPATVATGDFTGSGRPDLAIGFNSPNNVIVKLNDGNGGFADPGGVVLNPRNTPLLADLNGDGVPDLTVVDGAGDILFRAGLASQPGTFAPPVTVNPGHTSRDIALVRIEQSGPGLGPIVELASVDAGDDQVTLYTYSSGRFILVGSLPTGARPAQVVAADLNGDGLPDLVTRNAGDGTLSVFLGDGPGGFGARTDIPVGPGVSDLAVADVNGDGRPDLIVTNQAAGTVAVWANLGNGAFGPPTVHRAGGGLSALSGAALVSGEGTSGVAVGPITPGGPVSLVAINPGSNTLGVLDGLGGGLFADPRTVPTATPGTVVRLADLRGNGVADLVTLGANGVSVRLGDGAGGFATPTTYYAGPNPDGLTIADVNGDGKPDLIVGNAHGDVLVLFGEGSGRFQTGRDANRNVSLAVARFPGVGAPSLVVANRTLDQVVVTNGVSGSGRVVLADFNTGLLAPSAVVAADLNGDGIPDLVVANSGGNNILIYPGLPGGGFGPELNHGDGIFTGTSPAGITVADLDGSGHLDLIVANQGSNDVAILMNRSVGGQLAFEPGPRLQVGAGPIGTALYPDPQTGLIDLLVSDGAAHDVRVLNGRGGGFFDDGHPTIIPVEGVPGVSFPFSPGPGIAPWIVTPLPETGSLMVFSGVAAGAAGYSVQEVAFPGADPVAAFPVNVPGGFEGLAVADSAGGQVFLLAGGAGGLSLRAALPVPGLANVSALALGPQEGDTMEVYVATAGSETASLLTFVLGGTGPLSVSAGGGSGLVLLPLGDSSLPLVGTSFTAITAAESVSGVAGELQPVGETAVALASATGFGQGPFSNGGNHEGYGSEDVVDDDDEGPLAPQTAPEVSAAPGWARSVLGLDEAFEEFQGRDSGLPLTDRSPDVPAPGPRLFLPDAARPDEHPPVAGRRADVIDEAIEAIAAEGPGPVAPPLGADGHEPSRGETGLAPAPTTLVVVAGLLLAAHRGPLHEPEARAGRRRARAGRSPESSAR